jgi:taurine---2-oxoglutarate transaminase
MFIETVTGTNGLIVPPQGYLPGLRRLLDKYGILLVCDEVMCGLGRTGRWFACDHWNVVPDILTMAKGITSSYMPLGVVAVKPKIAQYFDEKVFSGGLTYSGHPLSLAAACATIKVLEEEHIIENAQLMGNYMHEHLLKLQQMHPCIGEVRSIGLFGAIELVKDRKSKAPLAAYTVKGSAMGMMMKYLRDHGVFAFSAANLLMTNPPLIVTKVSQHTRA